MQSRPIAVGRGERGCSTALSCTELPSPISMRLKSARRTAPGQTLASACTTTSPISCAVGCTKAVGCTFGTSSPRAYSVISSPCGCIEMYQPQVAVGRLRDGGRRLGVDGNPCPTEQDGPPAQGRGTGAGRMSGWLLEGPYRMN